MRVSAAVLGVVLIAAPIAGAQDTIRIRAGTPAWGTSVGLKEVYTIGGPPDYILGTLYATAIDRFNRMYIYDIKDKVLKRYGPDGAFLGTIGRQGSGPGEYRQFLGLSVIRDTMVIGWDMSNGRLTIYQPDGKLAEHVPMERTLTGLSGLLVSDTGSHIYLYSSYVMGPDRKPVSLPPNQLQWLRVSPEGKIVDSILEPQFKESEELVLRIMNTGNNFIPESSVWPSPMGGLVAGMGDTYRFMIRPLRGPVRVIEKDWKPISVGPDERSEWLAVAEALNRLDPKHPEYKIPKTKPAYRSLRVDLDGRIWVDLYTAAEKHELPPRIRPSPLPRIYWVQTRVFDLYDPAGRYLAKITLPFGSDLHAARGDRIWLRSVGPDGEDLLTAYTLTGIKGR